jgi:hypothetical protein
MSMAQNKGPIQSTQPTSSTSPVPNESSHIDEYYSIFNVLTGDEFESFYESLEDQEVQLLAAMVSQWLNTRFTDVLGRCERAEKQVDTLNAEVQMLREKLATIKASV